MMGILIILVMIVLAAISLIPHESNLQKAAKEYGRVRRKIIELDCQREQEYKDGIARSLARIEANLEALNKSKKRPE